MIVSGELNGLTSTLGGFVSLSMGMQQPDKAARYDLLTASREALSPRWGRGVPAMQECE